MDVTELAGGGVDVFNPFDPLHATGAAPHLKQSRQRCPVSRPDEHVVLVTSAADVDAVLLDHEHFSNRGNFILQRGPVSEHPDDVTPRILVTVDPPQHTTLRQFHRRWFTPARIRALQPNVRAVVFEVLDSLSADPGVDIDFVPAVAWRLPARVVFALIGLPEDDWEFVHQCFDASVSLVPNGPEHQAVLGQLGERVFAVLADRRSSGQRKDDLLDGYLHAGEAGEGFSDLEIFGHLLQLIGAGTDTTEALLANLFYHLLSKPERWNEVLKDRSLADLAIEETLRVSAPLQWVLRATVEDTHIAGSPVAARDRIVAHLQSANHDEAVWGGNSTEFDLHRPNANRHRSFGRGIHSCLGAPLARLEAVETLNAFLDRWPNTRLSSAFIYEEEPARQMLQPRKLPLILA